MSALEQKLAHNLYCHKIVYPEGLCCCGTDEAAAELAQLRTALYEANNIMLHYEYPQGAQWKSEVDDDYEIWAEKYTSLLQSNPEKII